MAPLLFLPFLLLQSVPVSYSYLTFFSIIQFTLSIIYSYNWQALIVFFSDGCRHLQPTDRPMPNQRGAVDAVCDRWDPSFTI